MNLTEAITADPGSYIPIVQVEKGRALWVTGVRRYVVELSTAMASDQDSDSEEQADVREVWTGSLMIVRELLGIDASVELMAMDQVPTGAGIQVSMW